MLTIKCSRKGDDIIEIFEIRFKYFIEGNIIARFLWNERNAFSLHFLWKERGSHGITLPMFLAELITLKNDTPCSD